MPNSSTPLLFISTNFPVVPSRITIGPRLTPNPADLQAPGREDNPINLQLGQTTVAGTTAPGSISIASAVRFRFTSINSLILPYWALAINGTAISGQLTQDHREEAAAINLLAAHVELAPCFPQHGTFVNQLAIAEGATLTGTITEQTVQLRIQGNTIDTLDQNNSFSGMRLKMPRVMPKPMPKRVTVFLTICSARARVRRRMPSAIITITPMQSVFLGKKVKRLRPASRCRRVVLAAVS